MHTHLLPLLLLFCLAPLLTHVQSHPNTTYLTAPALVTQNNRTAIQCWRILTPFTQSSTPGTAGAQALVLANATNLSYTVLPPRFDGGQHNAPVPQLVHFVSGLAHITLPDHPTQHLWLVGGPGGVVFAADTTGSGHVTTYPSDQQTVGLVAPFEGGRVPEYEIVREGGCEGLQSFV